MNIRIFKISNFKRHKYKAETSYLKQWKKREIPAKVKEILQAILRTQVLENPNKPGNRKARVLDYHDVWQIRLIKDSIIICTNQKAPTLTIIELNKQAPKGFYFYQNISYNSLEDFNRNESQVDHEIITKRDLLALIA